MAIIRTANSITPYRTTALDTAYYSFDFSTFSAFLDKKDCRSEKTKRVYVNNLRQFASWMKYAEIQEPAEKDIITYRNWLSSEHDSIVLADSAKGWDYKRDSNGARITTSCSPATVKLYMQSVKQFFKWTAYAGIYPNVAELVALPRIDNSNHRKEALQVSQVIAIERNIIKSAEEGHAKAEASRKDTAGRIQRNDEQGKRLYAMYLLAVNAGLRTIEISRANVRDLETINGVSFIYIWGKGHSEADRRKPIAKEVKEALDDYLASRTDRPKANSPLFVSTGNRSKGKRIATTTISTMLKQAMKDAGIDSERITAHSLRHTAGTAIMEVTGDNIYLAQTYMRHASPVTTEIYTHRNNEAMEARLASELYSFYHKEA